MSAARDGLFALIASIPGSGAADWCDKARGHLDTYREEVQREAAATVRAQAPKYLDTAEDIAVFLALDKAAGEIEPDKEPGK